MSYKPPETKYEYYARLTAYADKFLADAGALPVFKVAVYTRLVAKCFLHEGQDDKSRLTEAKALLDAAGAEMRRAEAVPCNESDDYAGMLRESQFAIDRVRKEVRAYEVYIAIKTEEEEEAKEPIKMEPTG